MLLSQNESSLTHFFTVTLNVTPMLMHSLSTQQLNSYYLQEDSMDRYLTELKMFLSFSSSFFIWLSLCFCLFIPFISLVCTYIPGVCNFFTFGFVGRQFCCNQFFIFLAFQLVQYVNVLSVQMEKKANFPFFKRAVIS